MTITNRFPLNIDTLKNNFKAFLNSTTEFSSLNTDGPGVIQIVKITSYLSQYISFYLNMISNESFIETAKIESNIYKLAHTLNYLPGRKAEPYLTVNAENTSATTPYTLPKYTTFTMGDINLVLMQDVTIAASSTEEILLYEGTLQLLENTATGEGFEEFFITEDNINQIGDRWLQVYVDVLQPDGSYVNDTVGWDSASTSEFNIDGNNYVIRHFDTFSIKFDNGRLFNYPQVGDRVRIEYIQTNGTTYNGSSGTLEINTTDADILANITFTITENLKNGTEEESLEGIKLRAPLFYTTQGRLINERDYNIGVQKYSGYDNFADIIIWSGHKEFVDNLGNFDPTSTLKDVGHAELAVLNNDYSRLDTIEEIDLSAYIKKFNAMSIFTRYITPKLIKFSLTADIMYISLLNTNQTTVETTINTYLKSLEGFEKYFYFSDIISYINDLEEVKYCNISFTTSVNVVNDNDKQIIRLNNQINSGSISATIDSTALTDSSGVIYFGAEPIGTVDYTIGEIIYEYTFIAGSYDINFTFTDDTAFTFQRESFLYLEAISINVLN